MLQRSVFVETETRVAKNAKFKPSSPRNSSFSNLFSLGVVVVVAVVVAIGVGDGVAVVVN